MAYFIGWVTQLFLLLSVTSFAATYLLWDTIEESFIKPTVISFIESQCPGATVSLDSISIRYGLEIKNLLLPQQWPSVTKH